MVRKINTCGIYKIQNKVNNKIYIGQSVEIEKRWNRHINELKKEIHGNEYLQRSWIKYGKENFIFEIIEICIKDQLDEKEKYWIKHFKSNNYNYGYNSDSGGKLGKKMNEQSKGKIGNREYPVGEDCKTSKLKNEQVLEIKGLLYEGILSLNEIAEIYGVGANIIGNIRKGKSYKNVKTSYDNLLPHIISENSIRNKYKKLSDEDVIIIKEMVMNGKYSQKYIAELFGVERGAITNILNSTTHSYIKTPYDEELKNRDFKTGENNFNSRLNEKTVYNIKKMLFERYSSSEIAQYYNISKGIVNDIKKQRAWKHIVTEFDDEIFNIQSKRMNNRPQKLTEQDIIQIKKLFIQNDDFRISHIAKLFNVSAPVISNILRNNIWKEIHTEYDDIVEQKLNNTPKPDNKGKLTYKDVVNIKKLLYEGNNVEEIADIYKVTKSSIGAIKNGTKWKNVTTVYDAYLGKSKKKINKDIALKIKEKINNGDTDENIANEFNINIKTVNDIRIGRTWEKVS